MPEVTTAREKIIAYLKENNISRSDLAIMYDLSKQDVTDYLSGRKTNPRGNKFIIRIISDFKIR